jgi:Fibronectin type III domain
MALFSRAPDETSDMRNWPARYLARTIARRGCLPVLVSAGALLAGGTAGLAAVPAAAAPASTAFAGLAVPAVAGPPAFVQQVSAHGSGKSSIAVTPGASVTAGDRLIVEVGIWNSGHPTAASVTDSSGDSFTEVTHFTASDGAELSVWTAPVVTGGTAPVITAKPTAAADMAIVALEYSGLSTVAGISAVDQVSHGTGSTTSATTVQSPATAPATAAGELAVGFYADSGFGNSLAAGTGFTARANVSPASDMELLAEDQPVSAGATPAASARTGASTIWLMATVVFASGVQSAPQPPTGVSASPGTNAANVSWTPGASGGSPITSYTVTPYVAGVAQPPTTVSGNPPATSTVVSGLTNGTAYTFTVSATNAIGTGPASAASNAITGTLWQK